MKSHDDTILLVDYDTDQKVSYLGLAEPGICVGGPYEPGPVIASIRGDEAQEFMSQWPGWPGVEPLQKALFSHFKAQGFIQ